MCGIAGYDFFDNPRLPGDIGASLIDALRHRGPDGHGQIQFQRGPEQLEQVQAASAPIGLVHTRLAIVDLSAAGAQPMHSKRGQIWLSFNGEIYNHVALRRELEQLGHHFRSQSDAEVILHGYESWGDSVVTRLRGMFAFAILDQSRDRWLLARDPFGIKPLVYSMSPQRLAFASDLNALRCIPGLDTSIDKVALSQYLALGYVPAPRSIVVGAQKLPRAHIAIIQQGRLTLRSYHPWPPRPMIDDPQEALVALHETLRESVRLHLQADVPVASFLSGGVDSSLISALAAEHGVQTRCFTMGFSDPRFDERPQARAIANHLVLPWSSSIADSDEVKQTLRQLPLIFDEPFADSSAAPMTLVARLARKHFKAVLSGDGGDELFLGYTRYRFFALANQGSRLPAQLRQTSAQLGTWLPAPLIDASYARLHKIFALPALRHPARKLQAVARGLQQADRVALYADTLRIASPHVLALLDPSFEQTALDPLRTVRAPDNANRSQTQLFASLIDEDSYLPEDILTKVDRATMSVGLEARVPLLDVQVRSLARAIVPNLHLRKGPKTLLRAVLDELVPPHLTRRPKQGFSIPLADWLRGPLLPEVASAVRDPKLADLGLSPAAMQQLVDEHQRGRIDHSPTLWSLAVLSAYLQRWAPA